MPIAVLVVIVGLMLIAAIVWNSRARRGTAANSDGSSWMWSGGDGGSNSGDSSCDSGSDGGGGCDGGGGDGGGGGD